MEKPLKPREETEVLLREMEAAVLREMGDKWQSSTKEPGEICDMEWVELSNTEEDHERYLELLHTHLQSARCFEIHCWNKETEQIHLALSYGSLKEDGWQYGKVVAGAVTPAFSEMLLHLPRPEEEGDFRKQTPFFNVFLDDHFYSSHYGTEIQFRK